MRASSAPRPAPAALDEHLKCGRPHTNGERAILEEDFSVSSKWAKALQLDVRRRCPLDMEHGRPERDSRS